MSDIMTSVFDLVAEDFKRELSTIRSLLRRAYANDPFFVPPSISGQNESVAESGSVPFALQNESSAAEEKQANRNSESITFQVDQAHGNGGLTDQSIETSVLMRSGPPRVRVGSSEDGSKVRIAASNACMLLLAASFEEYVRQMVKEFAEHLANTANDISEIPKQLLEASWERAIYLLNDATYGSKKFDHVRSGDIINRISEFHIKNNHKQKMADLVAYNANNMRSKEFKNVVGRVGIQDICGVIGSRPSYIQFFGVSNGGQARTEFSGYLDKFYEGRNEVAHSIGSLRVIGATEIERHIQFFEILSDELALELNGKIGKSIL